MKKMPSKLPIFLSKFIFLFLISFYSFSQEITKIDWSISNKKKEDLGKGLQWTSYRFENKSLFNSNQNINILETKLKNKRLKFALASADSSTKTNHLGGILKPTSQIAQKNSAFVAVNAGFFDVKNGGAVDFIKINNKVYDTSRISAKQRLPFKQAISALTIHKNKVKIIKGEKEKGWEESIKAENVLLTGPLLLLNSETQFLAKTAFNDNRHPRTCVCITSDKKLLILTIDGRASEAEGMSLHELTGLLKSLKCKDAINFDGGGSTTMYIAGKPENGVVNYPSDNKKFDHAGERSVSNIFLIK